VTGHVGKPDGIARLREHDERLPLGDDAFDDVFLSDRVLPHRSEQPDHE
jgi:hypothetical protein